MDFEFSRFEIVTGTGALFLCLVFVCLGVEAGAIQNGIATAAAAATRSEDLFWVGVEGHGRRLVLTGAAPDDAAKERAAAVAAAVPGVRAVDNRIAVVGDAGACQRRIDDHLNGRQVAFRAGQAELSPASLPVLLRVATIARGCGASFEVAAHTDAKGDSAINRKLSQRRAEVVVRYLVQSGVAPEKLRAVGYGETQPIADNLTAAGRAANSRVEFRILGGST